MLHHERLHRTKTQGHTPLARGLERSVQSMFGRKNTSGAAPDDDEEVVYDEFLSATNFLSAMAPLVAIDLHRGLRETSANSPQVHQLVKSALHTFLRDSLLEGQKTKDKDADSEDSDDLAAKKP